MIIIYWILFGALVGWIATMLVGKNSRYGGFANVAIGIVGAFVGGIISNLFGFDAVNGFNLMSIIIAVVGAVLFLMLVGAVQHNEK